MGSLSGEGEPGTKAREFVCIPNLVEECKGDGRVSGKVTAG